VASGIHQPNQSAKKQRGTGKGAGLVGTEVGGVELADGEAEALRLREAAVGEAAAAAASEHPDAVHAADGDVVEGEGGLNVAGVEGRRADAGRHRTAQRPPFVSNPPAAWNKQPTPPENIGHGNPQQINKCQEQTKPKCSKQPNESNDQQGEERGFQLVDGNEPQDRWQETARGWSAPALLPAAARAERRRRAGEMEAAGSPRGKRTVAVGGLPYLRRAGSAPP
jgi:hypothetical protein